MTPEQQEQSIVNIINLLHSKGRVYVPTSTLCKIHGFSVEKEFELEPQISYIDIEKKEFYTSVIDISKHPRVKLEKTIKFSEPAAAFLHQFLQEDILTLYPPYESVDKIAKDYKKLDWLEVLIVASSLVGQNIYSEEEEKLITYFYTHKYKLVEHTDFDLIAEEVSKCLFRKDNYNWNDLLKFMKESE